MNVLVVVAHPDDETIGCGATLAKLKEKGATIHVLLPIKRSDPRGVANWVALDRAFRQACEHLGSTPLALDPMMDEVAAANGVSQLHDSIVDYVSWADVVFSHWTGDSNQVHRAVSRAVEIATRPFRRRKEVYLFEISTSTDQAFNPSFSPNSYSIVTERQASRKCEAMSFYGDEGVAGRSSAGLLRRMRVRGDEVGGEFAEAFVLARHFF